jgi:hypothetical protein
MSEEMVNGGRLRTYDGIEVWIGESEIDGAIVVQIDTPVDTDAHENLRVYLNDAQAVWTSDGRVLVDQASGARP